MKSYPSYTDIGIEWLGTIPSSWHKSKLKYVSILYTGNSLNDKQKNLYESYDHNHMPYISSKDIDADYHVVNYNNGIRIPPKENPLRVSPKGSLLLCVEGGSAGKKLVYLDRDVCFVNKLCCFNSRQNTKFQYYFIQSSHFQDKFKISLSGLIGGVSISTLRNFELPLPPLPEQKQIVTFLDYKTQKIDKLIKLTEQKNERLKEQRIALINQCVTKGLNPNVEMKDSGVEWIGEIPTHWKEVKLKYFSSVTLGKMLTNADKGGFHYRRYLRSKNIQIEKVDVSDVKKMWFSDRELEKYRLKRGDLLFNEGGDVGRACIWNNELDECYIQNSVNRVQFSGCNEQFVLYQSTVHHYVGFYDSRVDRVSIPHLTKEKLESIPFVLPTLNEQTEIVKHLDEKTQIIDSTIGKESQRLELLKEYRQALISEVVTGKIDVRDCDG